MKLIRLLDNYVTDKNFSMIYRDNRLDIINYSEILDFSSTIISVRYQNQIFHIEGNNLVITKMMEEEILIGGNISSIKCVAKE